MADAVTGYFLVLGKGGPASRTTSASTVRRRPWPTWPRTSPAGRELFGYQGEVVLGESPEKEYLIDNPNRRSPDITKARTDLGFDPRSASRRACDAPCLVRRKPQRGGSMNMTEDGRRKTADGSKTHAPEQRLFRPPVGKGPAAEQR